MSMLPPVTPDQFLAELFSSRAAATGAVIRRNARDIDRYYGRAAFLEEMRRRGFAVVENAGQMVIFCNREPIRRLT
jgi:tRNA U55 pseudouridine synthase TruB